MNKELQKRIDDLLMFAISGNADDLSDYMVKQQKDTVTLIKQALTPPTSNDISLMITNAYGESFFGKWYYNKELNQFEYEENSPHSISYRYEHLKNLWTLNLNERIKVLIFFMNLEDKNEKIKISQN